MPVTIKEENATLEAIQKDIAFIKKCVNDQGIEVQILETLKEIKHLLEKA